MPLQVCACVCVSVCTACGSHMFALCVLWHVLASCLPCLAARLPSPSPLPSHFRSPALFTLRYLLHSACLLHPVLPLPNSFNA